VKQEWKVLLAGGDSQSASKRVVLSDKKKSPPRASMVQSGGINFPDLNNSARNRCLQTLYGILASDDTKNLIALQGRTDFVFSESEILTLSI
jgi:transcription elongation factor S-II